MRPFPIPVPDYVEQGVAAFVASAREALGESLVSVILFGGIAKGEYDPERSDVNLLVVLRSASVVQLRALAPHILAGEESYGLAAQVFVESDFERSTDVFPIMFLDMQKHHLTLHGDDLFDGLEVDVEHLRLRCEQGLKGLLLQLREQFVGQGREPEMVEMVIVSMVPTFLLMLNTVLILEGHPGCARRDEIAAVASERDPELGETLRQLLTLKRGDIQLDLAALDQLYERFLQAVEVTAQHVDAMG